MRFGSSSEFSAVDLLGSLATNAIVTRAAAKKADFRVGIAIKDKENPEIKTVPPFLDFRFLGGIAAAVAGQTIGNRNAMAGRVAHDLANGLLNSYVATESMRTVCMEGSEAAVPGAPAQLNEGAPAAEGAPAMAGNYAYGW